MAKCVRCGKRGFFLRTDIHGLCDECVARKKAEDKARVEELRLQKKRDEREKQRKEINDIPEYTIKLRKRKIKRNGYGFEEICPKFSNITPKGKFEDFVVFDTETTGLSGYNDRIIELAAVRFVEGKAVEKFHTYVNPEMEIPMEATKINGITDKDVQDAPMIWQVLPDFEAFIGNSILVAHNLEFDLKFVYYSGSSLFDTKRKYIDTLAQAKKLLKVANENMSNNWDVLDYTLGELCTTYGIEIADAHSAQADAYATGKLFLAMVKDKKERYEARG